MPHRIKIFIGVFVSIFLLSGEAFAYSGDIAINQKAISFSTSTFLEGRPIRIYATTINNSDKDLLGVVKFFDNDKQIGSDQAVSIFAKKTDDVFIDWIPSYGKHKIAVKYYPWEPDIDDPSNNWVVKEIFAIQDTDHDGTPNTDDNDDDNDGISDTEDDFPLNAKEQKDTDGDGIGDNADLDDDNDDVPDTHDDMPKDPTETLDTDKDGIGNTKDLDDDNDGLSDAEEENMKTNPLSPDTDGDGINDKMDAFPLDPQEWLDTDSDGIGNNTDTNDDNDPFPDTNDEFPLNVGPEIVITNETSTIGLLEKFDFDASTSKDIDGQIVSYIWEIDGKEFEGNAISHKFTTTGQHQVKLTVTDNAGESISKQMQVDVLNIRFYKQMISILVSILLALAIYFKYIAEAKNLNEE